MPLDADALQGHVLVLRDRVVVALPVLSAGGDAYLNGLWLAAGTGRLPFVASYT